jgi:hypothetical protein
MIETKLHEPRQGRQGGAGELKDSREYDIINSSFSF